MKITSYFRHVSRCRLFTLIIGFQLFLASLSLAFDGSFVEDGGIIAFEAEWAEPVTPWVIASSVSGYSGTGYFLGTTDSFSIGGLGVVPYPIRITTSGRYQLQWRSRITNVAAIAAGQDPTTEHNDSWARLVDADGNPVQPVSNVIGGLGNVVAGTWYKIYMNQGGVWGWQSSNRDHDARSLSWSLESGQQYFVQISMRSKDHAIDRIVLWDHNRHNLADKGNGSNANSTALNALTNSTLFNPGFPAVVITSHVNGQSQVAPASFTITADAFDSNDDGSIASVSFYLDGASVGTDLSAPYEATVSDLSVGVYQFTAVATDNEGLETTSEAVSFLVSEGSTPGVVSGEDLKQWHKTTVNFEGPTLSENSPFNPFTDLRLDVTFTHTETGESYQVPGYFAADGNAAETSAAEGNVWRAHFAPTKTGEWSYTASFRSGGGVSLTNDATAGNSAGYFDGDTGTFIIGESDKTGIDFRAPEKGKLIYTGEHALRWVGSGDRFFKVGMNHPETFLEYEDFDNTPSTRSYSLHAQDVEGGELTWKSGKGSEIMGVVNYLSNEGMNVQYFLGMNLRGDGKKAYPYTGSPSDENMFEFDVSKLAQWGRVFDYMMVKGVMPHFVFDEQENQSLYEVNEGGGTLFADSRKLYYREMVARFGHLNAITWNLGEENGWQNDGTVGTAVNTQQRKSFAAYFQGITAYEDIVAIHNGPDSDDGIYTGLLGDPNFTGAAMQRTLGTSSANLSYDRLALRRTESAESGHKWVVTYDEPWGQGSETASADHWRKYGLWLSTAAGSSGAEIWSNDDLVLTNWRNFQNHYPYLKIGHDFLFEKNVPFWRMNPDRGLVSSGVYATAELGKTYLIYLPTGGTTTLDLTGVEGDYRVQWFDPRIGGALQNGSVTQVSGGLNVDLGSAPSASTEDWVILVERIRKVAYIYESGSAETRLSDTGTTGLSKFKALFEKDGFTVVGFDDDSVTLNAAFFDNVEVLVLGKHQKLWDPAEKAALDTWIRAGGSVLTYNNESQAAINNILSAYGMEVAVSQANGTVALRAGPTATELIVSGRPILEAANVSPVAISSGSLALKVIPYESNSDFVVSGTPSVNDTQGLAITNPEYAALALATVGEGRIGVLFDVEPIENSGLDLQNNEVLVERLIARLTGQLSEGAINAVISATPTIGEAPFFAEFGGLSSQTNELAQIVSYEWDLDNDGIADATGARVSQEYVTAGAYTVNLTVTDSFGLTDTSSVTITAIIQESFGNGGNPWSVPGRIESEDYDLGGLNISYLDKSSSNQGGAGYRPGDQVDIETTSDVGGGYSIGYTESGEWLEYSIDATESGSYYIVLRAASGAASNGKIRVNIDGIDVTGDITIPTEGWSDWNTFASPAFQMEAGEHLVRVLFVNGGVNLNYMLFGQEVPGVQSPYGFIPMPLPGVIEAEDFDKGGANIAYKDQEPSNQGGGASRTDEGVDIVSDGGVGLAVGYTNQGEWLRYAVDVTEPGRYSLKAIASSDVSGGGRFRVLVDGFDVVGEFSVPRTTGWNDYQVFSSPVFFMLAEGEQTVEIQMNSSGFNLDSIEFVKERETYGNGGLPWPIPGIIEAENFDQGGQGVAYNDDSVTNDGTSNYRSDERVDLGLTTDGGSDHFVGWLNSGEWLEYTIVVAESGTYKVNVRSGSGNSNNSFQLLIGGVSLTSSNLIVPSSANGWQNWLDVVSPEFELTAGEHVLRFQTSTGNLTVNRFEFLKAGETFADYIGGYLSLSGNDTQLGADPDQDGIVNVLEQWLGLDPTVANRLSDYVGMVTEGGQVFFEFNYANALRDSALTVRHSGDLVQWDDLDLDPDWITDDSSGRRTVKVPVEALSEKGFFRINITE
jgi:PKD repeat protein